MLPMDAKPVTCGNDVVLTSKPCHQTSPVPYSNENRRNSVAWRPRVTPVKKTTLPVKGGMPKGLSDVQNYIKLGSYQTHLLGVMLRMNL